MLVNDRFANTIGDITEIVDETDDIGELQGWMPVKNNTILTGVTATSIDNSSSIAKKIAYLENLVDDATGNNPHVRDGDYDFGESYVDSMLKPFDYALNNNDFVGISDETKDVIEGLAFNGEEYGDNQKCWYFSDDLAYVTPLSSVNITRNGYDTGEPALRELIPDANTNNDQHFSVDMLERAATAYTACCYSTTGVLHTTDFESVGGNNIQNSEAAANSIINVKKLTIKFYKPSGRSSTGSFYSEFDGFIKNKVMYYLKQMIPSTTIFECSVENKN